MLCLMSHRHTHFNGHRILKQNFAGCKASVNKTATKGGIYPMPGTGCFCAVETFTSPQHMASETLLGQVFSLCNPELFLAFRPQNGSMILYNRKKVKYRKDGYCWKKRKDGKTTREDHMKLKVQGVEVGERRGVVWVVARLGSSPDLFLVKLSACSEEFLGLLNSSFPPPHSPKVSLCSLLLL